MKKLGNKLIKSLIIGSILGTTAFASNNTDEIKTKIISKKKNFNILVNMGTYIQEGFHSKTDVRKFGGYYNELFASSHFPLRLDSVTFLRNTKMRNGNINLDIYTIKGTKELWEKQCRKTLHDIGKSSSNLNLKKCLIFQDKLVLNYNIYKKCSKLLNKNYYRYGGKISVSLEDKYLGKHFYKSVSSDEQCENTRRTLGELVNNY